MENRTVLFVLVLLRAAAFAPADHIKVDMDARYDSTAAGFLTWQEVHGTSRVFGDLTVSFELIAPPSATTSKIGWENKNGLNKYELAMDCLYARFDDGTSARPSFDGGTFLLTLSGLATGPHTFISYHNALWPVSKYNRTISACRIYIDDVERVTVQPSQAVTSDSAVASTFLTFSATAGQPVRIKFEPVGDPNTQICTAVLNGFEIDNLAPIDSYAFNPSPVDGDGHVFANNDLPGAGQAGSGQTQLAWQASEFAAFHDVYFGTNEADVFNATPAAAQVYKGRQAANVTHWEASGLHSKETYFWRIDTVKADGSITKGVVWSFRTRRLAFASAEGYGRFARGGRFGRVCEVTTLDDYNPGAGEAVIDGSLRKAVEVEKGARVVIFRVGGTIFLKKKLTIPSDGGDVYVAGQTAPGEGICVARYPFGMLGARDAIIRFIRTRVGDYAQTSLDGMGMASSDHCMIDHCSISWSIDEGHSSRSAQNITFSYNIISEALNHSYQYADHSFAASISGNRGSYHHNLLAHCAGRNWSLAGGLEPDGHTYAGYCDIRNNVVYNWQHRTTDGGVMRCNFVNNLYLPGPASTHFLLMRPDGDQMGTGNPQMFYIAGNRMEGYPQYDADNWDGVVPNYATEQRIRSDVPFFEPYVTTDTVQTAYTKVLNEAGAIRPRRDAIDRRIVDEVGRRSFTYRGGIENLPGIIDSQADVGGYPALKNGPAPADSDHDGLPDWWELQHGLNPFSAPGDFSDTHADPDDNGFTQMDDYLEYLAQGGFQFQTYNCTEGIDGDLNGDCKVSIEDFEIFASRWQQNANLQDLIQFASQWLECNRDPATECR
jgi:hypothetical protein